MSNLRKPVIRASILDFRAGNGVPFRMRIVRPGDFYGLDNKLMYGPMTDGFKKDDPLIEFYDRRYAHTEHGQFVSRYFWSTLRAGRAGSGLCLDGGVTDWSIDSMDMFHVLAFIDNALEEDRL